MEKRNWKIYFEWIKGKEYKELAEQFNLSAQAIKKICIEKVPIKVRNSDWQRANNYQQYRAWKRKQLEECRAEDEEMTGMKTIIDRYKELANNYLCQRLKDLGVRQDAIRYWYRHKFTNSWFAPEYDPEDGYHDDVSVDTESICAAYSLAELGELLPARTVSIDNHDCFWYVLPVSTQSGRRWQPRLADFGNLYTLWNNANKIEDTEADARALLLIYLIENKLIEADVAN